MKERSILFIGEMIRAILDGRKTQVRRVIKPQPVWVGDPYVPFKTPDADPRGIIQCPYGKPSDRLWVRETFYIDLTPFDRGPLPKEKPIVARTDILDEIYYKADGECCEQIPECCCVEVGPVPWRPSIHMPRWASRIALEVTGVRVERLQDISRGDAVEEGITEYLYEFTGKIGTEHESDQWRNRTTIENFAAIWDTANEKCGFGWDVNPWVWVVEFRRLV